MKFEPARVVALLHRAGEVLDERLDDRDGALARFRRILEIDRRYQPALASCGRLYFRSGRWDDLYNNYEQELYPSDHPRRDGSSRSSYKGCEEDRCPRILTMRTTIVR